MPVGVLLAVVLFRTDIWGRRGLLAIIALAAFVPMPLHATAWLGALGNAGRMQALGVRPILVGRVGAAVVHALAALPWVVLLAGAGLCAVEPELEESALLEMGSLRVLLRITMRRAIGAIAAAGAGGRRADRRGHDRHRPAPGPHVCRGGLRPVRPGWRPGRRGGRRAAAVDRAGHRDRPGRPGVVAARPGPAGVGVLRRPDFPPGPLADSGGRAAGPARRQCAGLPSLCVDLARRAAWAAGRRWGYRRSGRSRAWRAPCGSPRPRSATRCSPASSGPRWPRRSRPPWPLAWRGRAVPHGPGDGRCSGRWPWRWRRPGRSPAWP